MLKHSAIVASVAGLEDYFLGFSKRASTEDNQETYLAYVFALCWLTARTTFLFC